MGRFDVLNGLVDNGWLGELTPTELAVWVAMYKHADDDGICWPSAVTLAKICKHSKMAHIHAARASLVRKKLLVRLSGASRFKLCLPDSKMESVPNRNDSKLESDDSTLEPTKFQVGTKKDSSLESQTDQGNKPENKTGEGTPPFDLGLLRGELRASHEFVSVLSDWLALKPKSPGQVKSILKKFEKVGVEDAIKIVTYSYDAGYPNLYFDRSKKNGSATRSDERPENLKPPILK